MAARRDFWLLARVSKSASWLVLWLAGIFLGVFLIWPVLESVMGAFVDPAGRPSPAYLIEVFRNPIYLEGLWNAVLMGVGSTLIALAIALPLAWMGDRYEFPLKGWLTALALAPMVLPPFVGAIGMRAIFGQMGALNARSTRWRCCREANDRLAGPAGASLASCFSTACTFTRSFTSTRRRHWRISIRRSRRPRKILAAPAGANSAV